MASNNEAFINIPPQLNDDDHLEFGDELFAFEDNLAEESNQAENHFAQSDMSKGFASYKKKPRKLSINTATRMAAEDQGDVAKRTNCGRWTTEEHDMFLIGYEKHGKSWKKISSLIPTRTLVQIRTHAQKYLAKSKPSLDSPSSIIGTKRPSPHTHHQPVFFPMYNQPYLMPTPLASQQMWDPVAENLDHLNLENFYHELSGFGPDMVNATTVNSASNATMTTPESPHAKSENGENLDTVLEKLDLDFSPRSSTSASDNSDADALDFPNLLTGTENLDDFENLDWLTECLVDNIVEDDVASTSGGDNETDENNNEENATTVHGGANAPIYPSAPLGLLKKRRVVEHHGSETSSSSQVKETSVLPVNNNNSNNRKHFHPFLWAGQVMKKAFHH